MFDSSLRFPMIFLTSTNHGCVYTLSQEDGDELYYAPIYANGNVNLEEFAPVDMSEIDMDDMEVYDIMRRLKVMNEVWRSENWHTGGCGSSWPLIHYIRPWETHQCLMNSGLKSKMLLVRFLTLTFLNFVMKSSMSMSTWTQTTITDELSHSRRS